METSIVKLRLLIDKATPTQLNESSQTCHIGIMYETLYDFKIQLHNYSTIFTVYELNQLPYLNAIN